ncbi:MAG: AAA family ATPase [Patescibacteria group bacterium]|nr:AAA family ATPase [Patescibacteria group bacterium]
MIIGLTGTFAAGKDTVANYLKNKGFFYTSLSDFIREECDRRSISKNLDNLIKTANELRVLHGSNYLAKLALEKIKNTNTKKALVVSIRNLEEYRELRKNPDFKLIAIDAPIELRYQRAINRGGDKDQISFEKFKMLEEKEMASPKENEMQMRPIIKSANYIINNESTVDELYKKVDGILEKFNKIKIKIKRIDKSLPLPSYQTQGSVAFDLYSRIDDIINPKEIKLIPTNFILSPPPEGYFFMLASRSSLPIKKGLMVANGVGIFDHDYCGPEDEYKIQLYNFSEKPVEIKQCERLAQLMLIRFTKTEIEETDEVAKTSRGGIGSTEGYN